MLRRRTVTPDLPLEGALEEICDVPAAGVGHRGAARREAPDATAATEGRAPAAEIVLTTRAAPDARVKRLRALGFHDGRVQRCVAAALAAKGGRCDTAQACALAYPGSVWTKAEYRNVRRALRRIARPVGRSEDQAGPADDLAGAIKRGRTGKRPAPKFVDERFNARSRASLAAGSRNGPCASPAAAPRGAASRRAGVVSSPDRNWCSSSRNRSWSIARMTSAISR
jgi:hypothetical protein